MQLSFNTVVFQKYISLFYTKYKKKRDCTTFLKYFKNTKIDKHQNWWEGISIFAPSTNNGCESTNSKLKKHYLKRKIHTFFDFFDKAKLLFNKNNVKQVRLKPYYPTSITQHEVKLINTLQHDADDKIYKWFVDFDLFELKLLSNIY